MIYTKYIMIKIMQYQPFMLNKVLKIYWLFSLEIWVWKSMEVWNKKLCRNRVLDALRNFFLQTVSWHRHADQNTTFLFSALKRGNKKATVKIKTVLFCSFYEGYHSEWLVLTPDSALRLEHAVSNVTNLSEQFQALLERCFSWKCSIKTNFVLMCFN